MRVKELTIITIIAIQGITMVTRGDGAIVASKEKRESGNGTTSKCDGEG
jgi:hypothetical protein